MFSQLGSKCIKTTESYDRFCTPSSRLQTVAAEIRDDCSNKQKQKLICLLVISFPRPMKNQFPNHVWWDNYMSKMFMGSGSCRRLCCSVTAGKLSAARLYLCGHNFNDTENLCATQKYWFFGLIVLRRYKKMRAKEEHMVCIHFDQRDWGSLYSLQTSAKSWSSLRAGKMESKYTCYWPQHSASDPAPISLTYLSSLHRRAERPLTRRSQSTNSVRSYFLQELHPNIQQDTSEKKKHHRREDILLNKYASEGFPTTAEPQ